MLAASVAYTEVDLRSEFLGRMFGTNRFTGGVPIHARYHIKPANMLGVVLGAGIFGIGMVTYGYCPGTGIAAVATGSVHALVGFAGMLVGGILYALSFSWVNAHILSVAALGKVRLPDVTGISDWVWFVILAATAAIVFYAIEHLTPES